MEYLAKTKSLLTCKLSLKTFVAHVRRRVDCLPPSSGVECLSWEIWEDKEFLSFISGKNGIGVGTKYFHH
jgi:hypothetical protein